MPTFLKGTLAGALLFPSKSFLYLWIYHRFKVYITEVYE